MRHLDSMRQLAIGEDRIECYIDSCGIAVGCIAELPYILEQDPDSTPSTILRSTYIDRIGTRRKCHQTAL